jgi:AhpD family alkylhydroperoxidase
MFMNWTDLLGTLKRSYNRLGSTNPKVLEAYRSLSAAPGSNGALDAKTRELIAMAVAVTTRCDGCISSHAAAAIKAGASEAEMSDALGVAIALNAGAAYVYSLRAMEAFGELKANNS